MSPKQPGRSLTGEPELDEKIDALVNHFCAGHERRYVREIVATALRLGSDGTARIDLKIANTALKEMRRAFRMFAPYRQARKVTVFGSARTLPEREDHARAVELGRIMAEAGWMVVTGAGSGIMGAAHEGAGRNLSVGVNIKLPFEQEANQTIRGDAKLIDFRYFFTRKLFLLKESHAVVLFPGGFGTLDECFEVLTLLQTGKQTPLPVVMVESPETGYFRELSRFIHDRVLPNGLISEQDLALYRIVEHPADALKEVLDFYRIYHSSRFVADKLLIRLERELLPEELASLNERFSDLLRGGTIEAAAALPEDVGTPWHRPGRITLDFNRRAFGRLRQLIDAINAFP